MNAIYKITHQLLNAVLHNNKLLIVGDKSFVVPVISTLKIFLEGKALELIYWVNTNNYSEFDIAGISPGRFLEVRDEMDLSNFIIIDINNSMVIQDPNSQLVSNQYLADKFNELIDLSKREAIGQAKSIINEINEQIFDIMGDKLTIKAMIYYEEKEKLAHSICRRINNW